MSEQDQQVEVGNTPTPEEQAALARANGQQTGQPEPEAEPSPPTEPATNGNGQTSLRDFLPEEDKKANENLILGKYKTQEDLETAYVALEKKLGAGETGPGLESPDAYLDEKNFDAKAFAEANKIDPEMLAADDPVMKSFAKLAHENGLSQEKHQSMLKGVMGILSEQMGVPLSQEAQQQAFHAKLKDTLGENYGEVIAQTARWVDKSLRPTIQDTRARQILARLEEDPDGIFFLKTLGDIDEGRAADISSDRKDTPHADLPSKRSELMKELDSKKAKKDPEYKQSIVDQLHALESAKGV